MAEQPRLDVKIGVDLSDLDKGIKEAQRRLDDLGRGSASSTAASGPERAAEGARKAAEQMDRAADSAKDMGEGVHEAASRSESLGSILSSISPKLGKLGSEGSDAVKQLGDSFSSTGKGASLMKIAGVAAIAGIAAEGIQAIAQVGQAIWNASKDAFKAFDPVQYSKTFGMLQKAVKSLKTALGGLVEGPMTTLVYLATALLQTVTKFIIKLYELMKKLDVFGVLNSWLKETFGLSEDLTASLDGTLATFDKLNVLGQDSGDQDTRDLMNGIKDDAEDAEDATTSTSKAVKDLTDTMRDSSRTRMDWSKVFKDGEVISKSILETLMSYAVPDIDWDSFFGDSPTVSREVMEALHDIAVPEQDWTAFFGDAPVITREIAETWLNLRIPEVDWTAFFGDSTEVSAEVAGNLMSIVLPVVDWNSWFGDAEGISRDLATTLLGLKVPDIDWSAFFARIDGKEADEVAIELGRVLQSLDVDETVDWDAFFSRADGASADEVAELLDSTLAALNLPSVDWRSFFARGDGVSADSIAYDLFRTLAGLSVPSVDWDEFWEGSDHTSTWTIVKQYVESGSSTSELSPAEQAHTSTGSYQEYTKVNQASAGVVQPEQTKKAASAIGGLWNGFKETVQKATASASKAIDDVLGTSSPSTRAKEEAETAAKATASTSTSSSSSQAQDFMNSLLALGASPQDAKNLTLQQFGHLASGGLIAPNNPRLYWMGDNTSEYEIVSPVSTMREAMRSVLMEAVGRQTGSSQPIELTINLDGKKIARQIYDPLQTEGRRRGATA